MIKIDFYSSDESLSKYEMIFEDVAKTIYKHLVPFNNERIVEVNIVNNEEIREINRDYRNLDCPTDVISFAFDDQVDGEVPIINGELSLLGQIIISSEKAETQAKEIGNSFEREMCFLFVHGILHLLGYDHMNLEDEKIMFELQREIMEKINYGK